MLNSGLPRPIEISLNNTLQQCWYKSVKQIAVYTNFEDVKERVTLIKIKGGSDVGEFIYISELPDHINYVDKNSFEIGDIILGIHNLKIAGFTNLDTTNYLEFILNKSDDVLKFECVPCGLLPKSLSKYLSYRFRKGSLNHDLQSTIRDNLYARTVPVTTRKAKKFEINGVDYIFLSTNEFHELNVSGVLLESGIYENNYYGTPRPLNKDYLLLKNINESHKFEVYLPGSNPSSEGKRKRNRSNVEAMSASDNNHNEIDNRNPPNYYYDDNNMKYNNPLEEDDLGPLPPKWEKACTASGEVYFIDHNTCTSHWLDPRLSRIQKKSLEDCSEDELPFGWERIDDPVYGTYFIDHVNRQTQYENPVLQAKYKDTSPSDNSKINNRSTQSTSIGGAENYSNEYPNACFADESKYDTVPRNTFFTSNPEELIGQRIHSTIVKSYKGLGFTIVGGDDSKKEFLQIKSIVRNGPAWYEGKLQEGDVIVSVNGQCVLGYTHRDMVKIFQSIAPGEIVELDVCRGYPLAYDTNDPNNDVLTTIAVGSSENLNSFIAEDSYVKGGTNNISTSSVKSMPDLYLSEKLPIHRPSSTDLILQDEKPECFTVSIVKGSMGFGFTIADSVYGQKVKKILDKQRCQTLQEGDILIGINNINVSRMNHIDVVQVLKDCSCNEAATIVVERHNHLLNNTSAANKDDGDSNSNATTASLRYHRSKTPTTDTMQQLDSSQNPYKMSLSEHTTHSSTGPGIISNGGGMNRSVNSAYPSNAHEHRPHPIMDNNNSIGIASSSYMRSRSPGNELEQGGGGSDAPRMQYWNGGGNQHQQQRRPHMEQLYDKHNNNNNNNSHNGSNNTSSVYSPTSAAAVQNNNYYNTNEASSTTMYNGRENGLQDNYFYPVANGSINENNVESEHELPVMSSNNQSGSYKKNIDDEYFETFVVLERQESGFGFRIVGGTEEGSQVSIGHIVPGGAAEIDGRLRSGDEIVSVDNQSVLNCSHRFVVQLMAKAGINGRVALGIRRKMPYKNQNATSSDMRYPYDVTVARREDEGFGFVIISSLNKAGSTIGRIIEGSPAERCGLLNVGDYILAVNGISIMNLQHGDIVNLIKDSGYTVTLTIGMPLDNASTTFSTTTSQREEESCDGQYYAIEINRGSRGFGFSIRGGREFHNMALFVLQIAENGPAALDGRLHVGDRLIEINGINTTDMTHAQAIEIIRNGGLSVRLLVQRGGKIPAMPPPPPQNDQFAHSPVQHNGGTIICSPTDSGPRWSTMPNLMGNMRKGSREPIMYIKDLDLNDSPHYSINDSGINK